MTKIHALVLGFAFVAAATLSAEEKVPAKFDPASLVGEWKLTSGVKDGEKLAKTGGDLTVTKDKMTLKADGETFEFSYKIDAKATPTAIDMEILAPEAFKGAKAKGIVAVDGKTFKLAYHPMGGERPKTFEAKKDSGEYSYVMTAVEKKK